MPQRLTPIEKAIAGTGEDRGARYRARRLSEGVKRVALWVPAERVTELKEVARRMVEDHDSKAAQND